MCAEALRGVAKSFAWHTSNYEGLSPRHIAELPEEGLKVLAELFNLCEVLGDYPSILHTLFVKLIPKPTGGYRPICLFRTLYRIHMKARSAFARDWEKEIGTRVKGFNDEPGRRITDGMYRSGVRNDLRKSSTNKHHGVELLRDLAKAFEAARRPKLWAMADKHRYPAWILRLSCNAYGWNRRLEMAGGTVGPTSRCPKGYVLGRPMPHTSLSITCSITCVKPATGSHGCR
mgnify:CR=1 FL=1